MLYWPLLAIIKGLLIIIYGELCMMYPLCNHFSPVFSTVRNNFRICYIATDSSTQFQKHCRLYPQLIQNMNFIWMPHWSKTELIHNALYHLQGESKTISLLAYLAIA
jgi:hypothetical protein